MTVAQYIMSTLLVITSMLCGVSMVVVPVIIFDKKVIKYDEEDNKPKFIMWTLIMAFTPFLLALVHLYIRPLLLQ